LFFVLSKTLGVIVLPTNLLVLLGVFGVLLLATRWASFGRKLMIASLLLFAFIGFSPLGTLLLYPLESRFPPWEPSRGAPDGIVVLGGSINADISVAHETPVIYSAADRIVATAELARKYPNTRIVLTGGSPYLFSHDAKEADFAVEVFEALGIDKARLIVERRSRNTYENAAFSKEIAAPKPGERWLLVTSAFHMPRAIGLFRKVGFPVEPYPVDWRVGSEADAFEFSPSASAGLARTDAAIREWIGLAAYRVIGRTDALFPGPEEAR
jgi:uncharacterized SAM-binding protein YcdF (DUF218 family)